MDPCTPGISQRKQWVAFRVLRYDGTHAWYKIDGVHDSCVKMFVPSIHQVHAMQREGHLGMAFGMWFWSVLFLDSNDSASEMAFDWMFTAMHMSVHRVDP